jgi:tetratricopeptide (TPR) repeat protein
MIKLINNLIFYISLAFFFVFPLVVMPITSELSEYNKLVLLILVASLLGILWMVKSMIEKRFVIANTPLNLSFLLILLSFIFSTVFSVSKYNSLLGAFNSWHFILAEYVALLIIFYAIVTNVSSFMKIKWLTISLFFSSFVVSLVALVGYVGLFKSLAESSSFFQILNSRDFSLAGNKFSLIVLLVLGILIGFALIRHYLRLNNNRLTFVYTFLTGTIVFVCVLWFMSLVSDFRTNAINGYQLNLTESWEVATSTIRRYPLFGTGLSTYAKAFQAFPPSGLNQQDYWNVVFTRSGNEYMTLLTTTGLFGVVAWFVFILSIIFIIRKSFMTVATVVKGNDHIFDLKAFLPIGVIIVLLMYGFYSSTVLTTGLLFFVLILWMLLDKESFEQAGTTGRNYVENVVLNFTTIKERLLYLGNSDSKSDSNKSLPSQQLMPWIIGVPMVLVCLFADYYVVRDFMSNVSYTSSIVGLNTNKPAREIYDDQRSAIANNPYRDVYHRVYADTNIRLANLIAKQYGQSITDSQRSDVVSLIQQAIREVRLITEVLDPVSSQNWEVRAAVYQNLIGIANGADRWALQSYQNAINLAPVNPSLRVNLAGLYLTAARTSNTQTGTQGDAPADNVPKLPDTKVANLARAELSLIEASRLKADYANVYYNLAQVYREANRYDLVVRELQNTLQLLDKDGQDYVKVQAEIEEAKTHDTSAPKTDGSTNEGEPVLEQNPTNTPTPSPN